MRKSEEQKRARIERLIESIYAETDHARRKRLVASLAEEEARNPPTRPPDCVFLRRRRIERLIDLIYDETDPQARSALVAQLAMEEARPPSGGVTTVAASVGSGRRPG